MIRYKLTDQNLQTYSGFQWKIGEKKTVSGEGELCSPGWLHCYSDPLLAMFLNPIHADFVNPRLFEVEVGGSCKENNGLKEGWREMTLLRELEVPQVSLLQRVGFSVICAKEVSKDPDFLNWSENWLNGEDRALDSVKNLFDKVAGFYESESAIKPIWMPSYTKVIDLYINELCKQSLDDPTLFLSALYSRINVSAHPISVVADTAQEIASCLRNADYSIIKKHFSKNTVHTVYDFVIKTTTAGAATELVCHSITPNFAEFAKKAMEVN